MVKILPNSWYPTWGRFKFLNEAKWVCELHVQISLRIRKAWLTSAFVIHIGKYHILTGNRRKFNFLDISVDEQAGLGIA